MRRALNAPLAACFMSFPASSSSVLACISLLYSSLSPSSYLQKRHLKLFAWTLGPNGKMLVKSRGRRSNGASEKFLCFLQLAQLCPIVFFSFPPNLHYSLWLYRSGTTVKCSKECTPHGRGKANCMLQASPEERRGHSVQKKVV